MKLSDLLVEHELNEGKIVDISTWIEKKIDGIKQSRVDKKLASQNILVCVDDSGSVPKEGVAKALRQLMSDGMLKVINTIGNDPKLKKDESKLGFMAMSSNKIYSLDEGPQFKAKIKAIGGASDFAHVANASKKYDATYLITDEDSDLPNSKTQLKKGKNIKIIKV